MLNAATYAARAKPKPNKPHGNFLQFKFLDKIKRNENFPNLDDLFLWNYHLTTRKFQKKCLESHLGAILPSLIDRPAFSDEVDQVREGFDELVSQELSATNDNFDRVELKRISGWTYWFQSRLLREFVWGEALNRDNGPRANLTRLRNTKWYMPFSHRPSWTAWASVMELALRKILPSDDCYPVESQVPTIYFKRQEHWETLRLEMGSYQRSGFVDSKCYTAGIETTWVLSALGTKPKAPNEHIGKRGRPFGRISVQCPAAHDIWRTASSFDPGSLENLKSKLPPCMLGVASD